MNENNKYTEIIVVEYTLKSRPTAEETSREIGLWRFKGFYFFFNIFVFDNKIYLSQNINKNIQGDGSSVKSTLLYKRTQA